MDDRGSATVLSLGLAMLLGAVAAMVVTRGMVVVSRHRVEAAADLAALAAAQSVVEGSVRACQEADRIAAANGARVRRCTVSGEVVDVEVAGVLRLGRLGRFAVVARAVGRGVARPRRA